MAIGEAGSITTNSPGINTPIRIDFTDELTNPVIALTATSNGGHMFSLRVISQDDTGFTFIIEEWEYLDGAHPVAETINWIAIEEGVHTLPDGRIIEAGTTSADHTNTAVSLTGGFADPPIVMTSVMSENDTTTVDSDPLNITASGFDVRLQEEEAEDNIHAAETVGYIAIQSGGDGTSGTASTSGILDHTPDTFGLGATYTNAIVVAETQTINGGNPGTVMIDSQTNSDVDLFFEEEQSQDSELNHIDETVGIVAFEAGLIPCFTPGALVATVHGDMPIEALRPGDLILTEDQGPQPLRWVCRTQLGRARLETDPHLRPVLIRKGALGDGYPARDLRVSPQHRMLITGWRAELLFGTSELLVPAKSLLNDHSVLIDTATRPVEYLHLLFDRHQLLTVDGTVTESLHAGQIDKAEIEPRAREELFTLFPELRCFDTTFGPTVRPTVRTREGRLLA